MSQDVIPIQTISQSPMQLHIASLVAHVRPPHFAHVLKWISGHPQRGIQVEIHAEEPSSGKLVIVTESEEEKPIVEFIDKLRGRPGVLNTALVYHEYLSERDLKDE